MKYAKTVSDTYGDATEVTVSDCDPDTIFLEVTDRGRPSQAALTPKQARRLAKALRKAAKIAKENA